MADRPILVADARTVLGKKVKQLRRKGILPANVYGHGLVSAAIQVEAREFSRSIKTTGVRGMFELNISGESAPRYVVIRGITRFGGTGDPMHVDFFQVDPNVPIHANVPVRVEGEAPAVRDLAGTLVHSMDVVAIRCVPLAIPEALVADAALLVSFEATVTVADLVVPEGVEVLTDPSVVLATVIPPRLRLDVDEETGAEVPAAEEPEAAG